MIGKYINFMGLDFNEIAQKKKSFTGFDKGVQIDNEDVDGEMFYFCCIMGYFYDKYDKVSFSSYYKFCVSLDAYLYSLMYIDEENTFASLIGFHPGRLFWHTVDNGCDEAFYLLNLFYRDEWAKKGGENNE